MAEVTMIPVLWPSPDPICHAPRVTSCGQCGFVYEDVTANEIAQRLRSFGPRYRAVLVDSGRRDELLHQRPGPGVWSVIEYACHVRDVLLVQRERTVRALVEDNPTFPPMYRDERTAWCGYQDEASSAVAAHLDMASELLAKVFSCLTAEEMARELMYNFPEPARRNLAWMGQHTVHEAEHHFADISRLLDV